MKTDLKKHNDTMPDFLEGQFLIAMPGMSDSRFARTVIYICSHTAMGAMGIVVNRPAEHLGFSDLLVQLDVIPDEEIQYLPEKLEEIEVMIGGPVETSRGFVLHSPDFVTADSMVNADDGICMTATVDMLRAIINGSGPKDVVLALGYAGWGPGQLESEIQANGWLNCPASADIIFHGATDIRYDMALHSIGIDLGHLSPVSGRA